ncbi:preprotein translocase subunit SecG [Flavobacteriales bacterium]|nr:preprotein translocase subunit SecG [Flavobacteriales bacterium]
MYTIFAILIIITSILLVLVVLVQNPKGGGLSSSFGGGAGNQIMGAKKTTDFLERSTWTLAIVLISLSLLSNFAIPRQNTEDSVEIKAQEQIDNAVIPNLPAAPMQE